MAGLEPDRIAQLVQSLYGGIIERHTQFEFSVVDSAAGKFVIELDASYMKELGQYLNTERIDEDSLEFMTAEWITKAAEHIVPWELVTPPIRMSELGQLNQLMIELRNNGALGTRSTLRYAFGLHLNPELPALDVQTILNYFRAFLCLYDWVVEQEQIDFTRRLTTYIKHFPKDYIRAVMAADYQPDLETFIDDYLLANPTRNRSMDMLPLFAYLDEERVRNKVQDARVNARPTLHYRLPNCDIDNPQWDLKHAWRAWLQVEHLANDSEKLLGMSEAYLAHLDSFSNPFENEWLIQTKRWISAS